MDKQHFLSSGLLEQYVLGLTSDEENREVERFAQAFPDIQEEINKSRHAIEEYALQFSAPPPAGLKSKILAEIEEQEFVPPPPRSENNNNTIWFSRLAAAALIILGFFCFRLYQSNTNLNDQLTQQSTEFAAMQQKCEEDRIKQQESEKIFAFLKNGQTLPVRLAGTALAPEAFVVVYWNEDQQNALLNVGNLPTPPQGKQYQIWADVEGEMIDMGVFESNDPNLQEVSFIANATSLNITLEPRGGSEHPTVELLMANGKV